MKKVGRRGRKRGMKKKEKRTELAIAFGVVFRYRVDRRHATTDNVAGTLSKEKVGPIKYIITQSLIAWKDSVSFNSW